MIDFNFPMQSRTITSGYPEPFHLELDQFLKGPVGNKSIEINRLFGIPFSLFMKEYQAVIPRNIRHSSYHFNQKSTISPDVYYAEHENGILMVDSFGNTIGCYLCAALTLDDEWQGKGLGRELVICRVLYDGANPVWNLDIPAYSPAGLAAHKSAWWYFRRNHR